MEQLDAIDREILRILQRDARSSNQKLAREVGLSPSPCWRRVRRLEERGIIRRYVTLLDPAALGLHVTALAQVSFEEHNQDNHDTFERIVQARPEILECHSTTGSYDYVLKIVCASIAAYESFLHEHLLHLRGVRAVNTSFVLQQKKACTQLPLSDEQSNGPVTLEGPGMGINQEHKAEPMSAAPSATAAPVSAVSGYGQVETPAPAPAPLVGQHQLS